MDTFNKKTLKTSRGFTYTYYTSPEAAAPNKSLPALLFCHGWPDDARLWSSIASNLRKLPFRMVIPDLLGYAGTSKPTEPSAYRWDGMTGDLIDILDAESIDKVIVVGHDWGSALTARFYNYYPARTAGLVLLNVPYVPPSKDKFELDALNDMTKQEFGYPLYMYWHFFTDPAAPKILKEHVPRLFTALHAKGSSSMKDLFCEPDAIKKYLLSDSPDMEVREYANDDKFKQYFVDRLECDGFEGPQNWYISMRENIQHECDSHLPEESAKVGVPVLYIGCTEEAIGRPEGIVQAKQAGLLPDVEEAPMVQAAHWSPYEKPAEMAAPIANWLERRFVLRGLQT